MNIKLLSPSTFYAAYLVVKFADRAYGLDFLPSEVSIKVGNFKSQRKIYLNPSIGRRKKTSLVNACFSRSWGETLLMKPTVFLQEEERAIFQRKDGWMEIELGRFFSDGSDNEVKISLSEVKGQHLKGGLIVEGIDLRPTD